MNTSLSECATRTRESVCVGYPLQPSFIVKMASDLFELFRGTDLS